MPECYEFVSHSDLAPFNSELINSLLFGVLPRCNQLQDKTKNPSSNHSFLWF